MTKFITINKRLAEYTEKMIKADSVEDFNAAEKGYNHFLKKDNIRKKYRLPGLIDENNNSQGYSIPRFFLTHNIIKSDGRVIEVEANSKENNIDRIVITAIKSKTKVDIDVYQGPFYVSGYREDAKNLDFIIEKIEKTSYLDQFQVRRADAKMKEIYQ